MSSFSIRKNLAGAAVALLLATPTTAAPPRLMSRECLANIVSDLSCAESSIITRCIAIEVVDSELLATCLEAAGCTEDEAENALWITEKCQAGPNTGDNTEADLEGELRRRSLHARGRRNVLVGRADSTTTSADESTTATSSATSTSTSETSTSSEASTSTLSSTSSSATSSSTGTSTSSFSTTSTTTTSSASATSTSSSSSVDIALSSAIVGTTLGIATLAAFGGVFICAWREGAAKRKAKREVAHKEALLANMG